MGAVAIVIRPPSVYGSWFMPLLFYHADFWNFKKTRISGGEGSIDPNILYIYLSAIDSTIFTCREVLVFSSILDYILILALEIDRFWVYDNYQMHFLCTSLNISLAAFALSRF
jgi:hypothetical protein